MPRVDLRVPFADKDAARRLGARWDAEKQVWYVPEDIDSGPLRQWVPPSRAPNVRSSSYLIASAVRQCWRCGAETEVSAIILPAGHDVLQVDDDPADDCWERAAEPTLLSYIDELSDPVAAQLRELAPRYRLDFSQTTQSWYWMNHCEHCAAKLGDFDTHEEFGAAFNPATAAQAAGIGLCEMFEAFAASCGGYTFGIELFEQMQPVAASGTRERRRKPPS